MNLAATPAPDASEAGFKARGRLYLGTRTYFESQVTGGYARLLVALPGPLSAFMAQPFDRDAFYEVMHVPDLIAVEAEVAGLTVPRYLDRRTAWQANRDFTPLSRALLRVTPAAFGIRQITQASTQIFNFGRPRLEELGQRHLLITIEGVPRRLCAWLEHSIGVYAHHGLSLAARGSVATRVLPPVVDPYASVQDIQVDVKWG